MDGVGRVDRVDRQPCDTTRTAAIVLCIIAGVLVIVMMCMVGAHFLGGVNDFDDSTGQETGCGGCRHKGAALQPSKNGPQIVTSGEEIAAAAKETGSAVVMFHAKWCGACVASMPTVVQNTKASPYAILTLEATHLTPALQSKFNVSAFPTFARVSAAGDVEATMRGGGVARITKFFGINP
jgi:thiol-disulfide isomerase/thioredoxin